MREVTRFLYRWYDPLRERWFKSRIKLTEEELQERYPDGFEILRDTAEKHQELESREEWKVNDAAFIPFDRKF